MIRFPAGLPRPQRDDYEFTHMNKIMRTPMESGRAMQRILWDEVPDGLTGSFVLSHTECRLFTSFVDQVAKSEWFLFPVYDAFSPNNELECRFTSTPEKQKPIGVTHWQYTFQMEIRIKQDMPPGWAEILPGFVLFPDIFDIAMNKKWPLV